MGNDGMIAVRLVQEELDALDKHTQGGLSRAQIVRLLIQDFLEKTEEQQREFLIRRLFGK
jgi:metal-responsive CopG/Arc/MetJ family transcriptional regulator